MKLLTGEKYNVLCQNSCESVLRWPARVGAILCLLSCVFFSSRVYPQSSKSEIFLNSSAIVPLGIAASNDDCNSAQTVTPDGTCYTGTTVGANDSWVGTVGCQSGNNHPDVWYTFIATGSSLSVNVTAGTLTGNIEFVLVSATGTCAGLANVGSLCRNSPLTGTINGLQTGTRYYYTISSSTASQGTFTACVTNTSPAPVSGQDCSTAAILSNGNTFTQSTSNAGFSTQEVNQTNSCWLAGGERQSKWFKFTASNNGTLQFNIKPVVSTDDYDWALWDITSLGCPSTSNSSQTAIACNWSGCTGSTGLTSCSVSEPGANNSNGQPCLGNYAAWNSPVTLTAGHTYALLVDNFTTSNSGFSLTFGGGCNLGTAIIGPDARFANTTGSCGTYNFTATYPTSTSTYLWQFGDGTTSTLEDPIHTYATSGNFIITLQVTDALGAIDTYSQTISIASATATASSNSPVNSGSTLNLSCGLSGATYSWTGPNGFTSTSQNPSIPNITAANGGTYIVSTNVGGCTSSASVVVSVNGCPTITTQPVSQTDCKGNGVEFTAFFTGVATANYQWEASTDGGNTWSPISAAWPNVSGASGSGASPITLTVNNVGIGGSNGANLNGTRYRVVITDANNCSVTSSSATLTVNEITGISPTNTQTTICEGGNFSLTVNTSGATPTSFQWTKDGVNIANGGNVSITNPTSASSTITITSATPSQSGSYRVAVTFPISVPNNNGAGAITCNETSSSLDRNLTVSPVATIGNKTATTCSGIGFTVTPANGVGGDIVPAGTSYIWGIPTVSGGMTGGVAGLGTSITGTLTNPTNSNQTATYTVTPTSGTCAGSTFTVTVTVNPIPSVSNQTTSTCSGTAFSVTPAGVPAGTSYTWGIPTVSGGMTGGVAGLGTSITGTLTNPTNSNQTATYTVTPTSGTCVGSTFTVTVTVNPIPSVSNQTTSTCSGTAFSVTPAGVPAGTSYTWGIPTVSGGMTGGVAGLGTSITGTLTNPTNSNQTATYTVTPTSGTCAGSTFTVTVTVNPIPSVSNQTTSTCSGTAFSVTPAGVPAGTSYTWGIPTVSGGMTGGVAGLGTSITGTLTNPTNSNQTATYTVTPTSGTCAGSTFTVTVTLNPKPAIANKTATICSGNAFTVTPTNGTDIVPAGTTYTWTIGASSPAGAITGASAQATGQTSISQTLTNTTNAPASIIYTVTPTSGTCAGSTFTVTVTVNAKPTVSVNSPVYCTNASAPTITATPGSGLGSDYNYSWTVPSGVTDPGNVQSFTATVGGSYSVVITNKITGCSSLSQSATLTISSPPTITTQPQSQGVCQGGNVVLSVTATGAATYQWLLNGSPVAGATGSAYAINSISRSQNGDVYSVIVQAPVKLTTLRRFKLTSVGRFNLTTSGRSKLTT